MASYVESLPRDGHISLWLGPLTGEPTVTLDADRQHYAASTMKLALVIAAHRSHDEGALDLDARVVVHSEFGSAVSGAGFAMDRGEDSDEEPWRRLGTKVSLRWLAHRAIVRSSNLATNLLLEAVGLTAVSDALAAIRATSSVVARGIEDEPAREAGKHNLVTAADLALTLSELAAHRTCAAHSAEQILATLAAQQINDAIPAGLPPGTKVAHKSGWVDGVSHDAGIVYPDDSPPYVLVVCTTSALSESDALTLIAAAARASWQDRGLLR
jgi:beta-lactamase class A